MLFSFPKLTDDKARRTKATWIIVFHGYDESSYTKKFEIIIGWCADLMHPRLDKGRLIPALLALQWRWATYEAGWPHAKTYFHWRSDWKEIFRRINARRLAAADA
jgi:hypothetical protein